MTPRIILILLLIPTLVFAYSVELRWTRNAPSDNVKEYKVYRCMSSIPRVKRDPRYTNISSVKFTSATTATVRIHKLVGVQSMYVTATNTQGLESGASNTVFTYDQFGNLINIRLVKE
jgi:hypothetical protein